jgi:competence ComEA-like helix-hairpin-helix protein
MKKFALLAIGALIVMLSFGGMAYAAGEEGGMGAGAGEQAMDKVDLNTAGLDELQSLPGMDQELAQNIIDYREASGPFSSVDDLVNVEGFDSQMIDSIRDQVTVGEQPSTQPLEPAEPGGTMDQPMGEPLPGEAPEY